jgi:hypothetical protein
MKVRNLILFLLSSIIGILVVKYFFLNTEESSHLNALLEKFTSSELGYLSRLGDLLQSLNSKPSKILWLKLCIGSGLAAFLIPFVINKLTGKDESLQNESTDDQSEQPTKKCPVCAGIVMHEAKVCQFCNHHFLEVQ